MTRRTGWGADKQWWLALALAAALAACSSGRATPATTTAGTGGQGAYGGQTSTGGSAGSAAGGSAGSGTPVVQQGQVVVTPKTADCKVLEQYAVLDSQYAYYVCRQDPPAYSNIPQWTFYRASIPSGTPEPLVTSNRFLYIKARDDSAYYLWKYEQYDPTTDQSSGATLKRLPFGSQTLQDFAPGDIRIVGQNQSEMFLLDSTNGYTDEITSVAKPAGPSSVMTTGIRDPVDDAWLTVDRVGWASALTSSGTAAVAYQMPLIGSGTPQKLFDFPPLCENIVHDASSGGFWAFCSPDAQWQTLDIVLFSASGARKTITKYEQLDTIFFKPAVVGTRLYWVDNDSDALSLRSVDPSGATTTLLLPKDSSVIAVLGGYVYFAPMTSRELRRVNVSAASTP